MFSCKRPTHLFCFNPFYLPFPALLRIFAPIKKKMMLLPDSLIFDLDGILFELQFDAFTVLMNHFMNL